MAIKSLQWFGRGFYYGKNNSQKHSDIYDIFHQKWGTVFTIKW